ncbi:MAG: type IV pili methyl-accepting chemotaxis transducer N-terminal domain-containing protein [Sulfurovaceae bacterium]|nr:type IV pili methyl-accepting chemotaxis transducer N-terminal domain-containing protein [Sulfurovaceae bacterium]
MLKKIIILILLGASSYPENSLMNGLTNIVEKAENKKIKDKKVINYAFKQRMRTQSIARDALLITMDINRSFYQEEILKNADAFNENFNNLIGSKKDIKKIETKDPNFEKKIEDINSIWRKFHDSIKKIAKNPKDKEALKFIEENNIKLLDDVNYIFTNFIKSYQSTDKLEASMAHIKSMLYTQVGKPRTYINKLVKERLSVQQNINKKDNEQNLKNTIKDMDRLMKALKDGDKELELNGTEDINILKKLDISQKIWEEVKKLVQKKKLTDKELITILKKNKDFIKAQTEVIKLVRESNEN